MSSPDLLLRVVDRRDETADATTLVLEPERGQDFDYAPGQFITFRIPTAGGAVARSYSLSSSPHCDTRPEITVKRMAHGHASRWMHEHATVGSEFQIKRPAGTFTPTALDGDLQLFASGSGISPVLSIMKSALTIGSGNISLLYRSRDSDAIIFGSLIAELRERHPNRLCVEYWTSDTTGRPAAGDVARFAGPGVDCDAFICGPVGFIDTVRQGLHMAGRAPRRIFTERFASLEGDPFSSFPGSTDRSRWDGTARKVSVRIDGADTMIRWRDGEVLLDAMISADLDVPYSCREGACGACICRVTAGGATMLNSGVLDQAHIDDGYLLACQTLPDTEELRVTYDD